MTLTIIVNQITGALTVFSQVTIVFLLLALITKKFQRSLKFFGKHALLLSFVIVLTATISSLTYSDIIGYEPCKLCWLQRTFMYPQVIILGLALWKKDKNIEDYPLALSAIGAFIASYHYLLQLGVAPALPCSAVGYSVSCAQRFVMQYGYITIPMMALTTFVLVIVLLCMYKIKKAAYSS